MIMFEGKPKNLRLTEGEIDAYLTWIVYRKGIQPFQWHDYYTESTLTEMERTMVFPEQVKDILKLEEIFYNKQELDRKKAESKARAKNKARKTVW